MRKTRVKFLQIKAALFPQKSMKVIKREWREEKKPISRKFKVSRKNRQRERDSEVVEMSVSVSEEKVEEGGWDE